MSDPQTEIRLLNMQGEIDLLKEMVRHLLETRTRVPAGQGPQLAANLVHRRKVLGESTPERVAFENAVNKFGVIQY
jgi:hypothetical protein